MHALEITDLHKHYGAVHALRGVSLAIDRGEVFGYLGPNGAGKTTTLRIAADLVHADRGVVRLLGEAAGHATARERVGYLPGEMRLEPSLTGRALIEHYAGYRRRPPVLRDALVRAFDLRPADLGRRVKFLSHGTRQKLGLVVAMQHDPDLLLFDEPTLGLDPLVQSAFREVVLGFAARGKSVLLSSHVLSEVEAICGRIAIVRSGEIVTVETIAALRSRMVRRARVRFRGDRPADLASVAGVIRVEDSAAETSIWLSGDEQPLLRRLAACELERVVLPEPELEDIFMDFYSGPRSSRANAAGSSRA